MFAIKHVSCREVQNYMEVYFLSKYIFDIIMVCPNREWYKHGHIFKYSLQANQANQIFSTYCIFRCPRRNWNHSFLITLMFKVLHFTLRNYSLNVVRKLASDHIQSIQEVGTINPRISLKSYRDYQTPENNIIFSYQWG